MEGVDELEADWLDESCEELIKELLDDNSPLIISPQVEESSDADVHEAMIKKLHSSAYSGPTISDIENALPTCFQRTRRNSQAMSYYRCTNPRCNAKKQVERSKENPEILIVAYEGIHLHYTSSNFILPQTYSQRAINQSPRSRFQTSVQQINATEIPHLQSKTRSSSAVEYKHHLPTTTGDESKRKKLSEGVMKPNSQR